MSKKLLLFLSAFIINVLIQISFVMPAIRVILRPGLNGEVVPDRVYGRENLPDGTSRVGFFNQDPSLRPVVPAPLTATSVVDFSEPVPQHRIKFDLNRQSIEDRALQQINLLGRQIEALIPGFNAHFNLTEQRGMGNRFVEFVNNHLERFLGGVFNIDRIELDVREYIALKYPGFEDLGMSILRGDPFIIVRDKSKKIIENFYADQAKVEELKKKIDELPHQVLNSGLTYYRMGAPILSSFESLQLTFDAIAPAVPMVEASVQKRSNVFDVEVNRQIFQANTLTDPVCINDLKGRRDLVVEELNRLSQHCLNGPVIPLVDRKNNLDKLVKVYETFFGNVTTVQTAVEKALLAHEGVPKFENVVTQLEQAQLQKQYELISTAYHDIAVVQQDLIKNLQEIVSAHKEIGISEDQLNFYNGLLKQQNALLGQCNSIDTIFKGFVDQEVIVVDGVNSQQPVQPGLLDGVNEQLKELAEANEKRREQAEKDKEVQRLKDEAEAAKKSKSFIEPFKPMLKLGSGVLLTGLTAKFLYDYRATKKKELAQKLLSIQGNSMLTDTQKQQAMIDAQKFSKAYALTNKEKFKVALLAAGWASFGILHRVTGG